MSARRHHHMAMDSYAYKSGMLDWNPEWKTAFSILALVFCVGFDRPSVSVFTIVCMGILSVNQGKVPLKAYLNLMKIPAAFLVMGTVAIAVGISKAPAGDWALCLKWCWIYTSKEMLLSAAEVCLKALGGVSALYMLALSTPSGEWIHVLREIHLPSMIIDLMYLIYRFIFIIGESERQIRMAADARLGYRGFRTSCGKTSGSLLILSLKKARVYNMAMESRGYQGELVFLEKEKRVTKKQIGITVACLLIMVILKIR